MAPRYIVRVRPNDSGVVQFSRPPQPSDKYQWIPSNFIAEYKLKRLDHKDEDRMQIYRHYRPSRYDPVTDSEDSDQYPRSRPVSADMPYHLGFAARAPFRNTGRMAYSDDSQGPDARLVTFFRNGDSNYKGFQTSISHKKFATFETLLIWLNEKIPTTSGVRHVFAIPEGYEVSDISDFMHGRCYVVCGSKRLNRRVVYGYSRENYWYNRKMTPGKNRRYDRRLLRYRDLSSEHSFIATSPSPIPPGTQASPTYGKPRIFTLISNTHRGQREKVILNPNTTQTYEEILHDCTNIVKLAQPPVQALWTAKPPFKRVQGISSILREFKDHDTFIACGMELKPFEIRHPGARSTTRTPSGSRDNLDDSSERTPRTDDYDGVQNGDVNDRPLKSHRDRDRDGENGGDSDGDSDRGGRDRTDRTSMALVPVTDKQQPYSYGTKNYMSPRALGRGMDVRILTPLPRIGPGIDTGRYKGDSYNQLTKKQLAALGAREDRVNVVRVDIHGKRREFMAPTDLHVNDDGRKPDRSLHVDWVYGYRGKDSHCNPQILRTGEIIYYISNFAVIYDRHRDKQRHYVEHNEDIMCLDVHTRLGFVATGQASGGKGSQRQAHIRVWDYRSLTTYMILGLGSFTKGICAVSFSHESGIYLLAVDLSNKHVMTIWDWENDQILAKTTTSPDSVLGAHFHPHDETVLITYGKLHISFWKVFWDTVDVHGQQQGRILRDKKSGVIEPDKMPQCFTSLVFSSSGEVITGDSSGGITVWSRDHNNAYIRNTEFDKGSLPIAHHKPVLSLCMMTDGTLMSGGGSQIKAWDADFRLIKDRTLPDTCGNVCAIIPQSSDSSDGSLYVGTTNNMILEGSLQEKFTNIIQGHSDELWGLVTHPQEHAFFTCSHDCNVIKWSATHHHTMWKSHLEKQALCVSIDPKCSILAVGCVGGRLIILDANTGMHMCSLQISADNLGAVTFSPDGGLVAVGSHDNAIYIYSVLDGGQCLRKHQAGVLTGHRNFITHIDWSRDGRYLQSVSGDYDLRYWSIEMLGREKSTNLFCDMEWATQNCIIGHSILGAWSNLAKGEDINAVSRSNRSDLMVVGENKGMVRVYKYPCSTHKAEFSAVKPYSSHVTNVQFTYDDAFLITAGGSDSAVVQWSLVEPRPQLGDTAS